MKRSKANNGNRLCAFLLALVMVFTVLPVQALTASAENGTPAVRSEAIVQEVTDEVSAEDELGRIVSHANPAQLTETELPEADEEVRVIIELDTESLVETWERNAEPDGVSITDYLSTSEAQKQLDTICGMQDRVLRQMETAGISAAPQYSYTTVAGGFSAVVPYGEIGTIEAMDGVKSVHLSEKWYTDVVDTETQRMQSVTDFSNSTEYQGQGVVIGILDTGLDWTHEAFANDPKGARLTEKDLEKLLYTTDSDGTLLAHSYAALWTANYGGYKLTADELYVSAKVPFAFDYADVDTDVIPSKDAVTYFGNDHGTHVAGTAAGKTVDTNGNITFCGEAPEAQLAIFKVFSDTSGGAYTDVVLAALNDAIVLGVDVINMSLGSSGGFAEEAPGSTLDGYYTAVEAAGILLNCSAGNAYSSSYSTTYGDYALTSNPDTGIVGSASSYAAALSVASINSSAQASFTAGGKTVAYQNIEGHDFALELLNGQESAELSYVMVPRVGAVEDFEGLDVAGKIAVIQRGSLSFEEKQQNAVAAGAIGCLIYNNKDGYLLNMAITDCRIPTAAITLPDGEMLAELENPTLKLSASGEGCLTMSDFSSWGPLPGLELKPEITAPGGDIYSSLPYNNSYGYMSGTSMASPYMAGVTAALTQYVKKLYPSMSAADRRVLINRLAMSTAEIVTDEMNGGIPYSPRKQGAGLVNLEAALESPAYLYVRGEEKTKLELGDDPRKTGIYTLEFHVQNMTTLPLTYEIDTPVQTEQVTSDGRFIAQAGHALSADTNQIRVSGGSLNGKTLSVPAGGDTTVTVTVTLSQEDRAYLDANFENGIYVEGFVTLTSSAHATLSIPYLAFYGDWTQAPILDVDDFSGETPAVYATKVGGLMGNTYLFNMGHYLFDVPEGVEEPAPSKDKIALTMGNGTGVDTLYYLQAGMLRGAKEIEVEITDLDTDQLYAAGSGINFRKCYYNANYGQVFATDVGGTFSAALSNNSRVHYAMKAYVDADGAQNNKNATYEFDFTVDGEAPRLVNGEELAFYQGEDGRMYLDVQFSDNHYLMAAMLVSAERNARGYQMGEDYYDYMIPCVRADGSDAMPEEVLTMTFDVTDFYDKLTDEYFYILVYDYALNYAVYQVQMPFVQVESISLAEQEITIKTNEIAQLQAILTPENATTQEVMWSSSNLQVVRVQDGEITGMKPGTVTITAIPVSNKNLSATCTVTVTSETLDPIPMRSFTLNETEKTLEIGRTYSLRVMSYEPYNASSQNVTWTSSDESIATVNQYGTVTAVASGEVTVTAHAVTGDASTDCRIIVPESAGAFVIQDTTLVKYNGSEAVVSVPDGITEIASRAFANNASIQEVYLPNSLQTLGESAFNGCSNLTKVTFPETMTAWGSYLFQGCSKLTEVGVPNGITEIPASCFNNCTALTNVTLPDTVTSIGSYAFANCKAMTEIILPDSVKTLDSKGYQWYNCSSVTKITLSASLTKLPLSCFNGLKALEELPDLKNVTVLGDSCFRENDKLTSVTIPAAVEKVGYATFYGCDALTSVHFDGTPEEYGSQMFYNCKALTSVTGNLNTISSQCFYGCTGLTQFVLPDQVTYIGDNAFQGCTNLTALVLTAESKLQGGNAFGKTPFNGCSKLEGFVVEEGNTYHSVDSKTHALYGDNGTVFMVFPYKNYGSDFLSTTKVIGSYALAGRTATASVTIPDSVVEIGDHAFDGLSKLTVINLPDGVTKVGDFAFNGCRAATALELGGSLTEIGMSAFQNCARVTTVTLPSTVRTVGQNAFSGCSAMTTLNLNEGLESIGSTAFNNCSKLTKILIPNSVQELGEKAFYNCAAVTSIDCGSVTVIPSYCFYGCKLLTEVKLSDEVTEIGDRAFYNCQKLPTVAWPSCLETIGDYAFNCCWSLQELDFSGTRLHSIGFSAFYQAYAAETLVFPDTLTELDEYAFRYLNDKYRTYGTTPVEDVYLGAMVKLYSSTFQNCPYLKNIYVDGENPLYASAGGLLLDRETGAVVIWPTANDTAEFTFPSTVTQIPSMLFLNNKTLKKVHISGSVTKIGYAAFQNSAVEEVIFEDSETTCLIDSDAFNGCTELSVLRLPDGLVGIGYRAFQGCTALTQVELPNTVYDVADNTFAGCTALERIKLSDKLTSLASGMFAGCASLKELTLPAGLSDLGIVEDGSGFVDCTALRNVYVDADSRNFRSVDGVLYDYNGKTLRLYPAGRTETDYEIPEGVTRVGSWAFSGNASLQKVSLPSTLTRVGNCAFYGCENLKTYIFFGQTAPLLETRMISGYETYYANFTGSYKSYGALEDGSYGYLYTDLGLTMYRPENSTGYDTEVWQGFFGTENGRIIDMTPSLYTVTELTAAEGEKRTAVLTWTEAGRAAIEPITYTVERAVAAFAERDGQGTWIYEDFETLAQGLTACTYTDATTLSIGITYAYRVSAYNMDGESGYSAVVTLSPAVNENDPDEVAAAAVIEAIEALKPVDQLTAADAARVQEVKAMYDALTDAQKVLVPNESILSDAMAQVAAAEVAALIAQLPDAENVTLADETAIAAARAAYDALTEEEKVLVTNLSRLEAAEAALTQKQAEDVAHKAAAAEVEALIAGLPDAENVTLSDEAAIAAARAAYEALTEEEKALVTNLSRLEAAEAALAQKQAEDVAHKFAAALVEAMISKLPDGKAVTLADEADIIAARAAYDALTEEEKELVANLNHLEAAEAALAQKQEEAQRELEEQQKQQELQTIRDRFTDIDGHWAEDEIVEAVWRGLFNGTADDTFAPELEMSRAMFVTVLWRAAGEPAAKQAVAFKDVGGDAYYAEAVAWAVEIGVTNGTGEDRFSPDDLITREQLATFLYRYAQAQKITLEKTTAWTTFADADEIHAYAKDAMTWAVESGLIGGYPDGTVQPNGEATRAECAVILVRFQEAAAK